jgi:hypothetical protein
VIIIIIIIIVRALERLAWSAPLLDAWEALGVLATVW